MSLMQECPLCHSKVALKREICGCGAALPSRGRALWVYLREGGKLRKQRLGVVPMAFAKEFELKERVRINEEKRTPKVEGPVVVTWGEVVERYLRKVELSGTTWIKTVSTMMRRMVEAWGRMTPATAITPTMIRDFQAELRESGKSFGTCDRFLASAKAAWNLTLPDTPNPFRAVKLFRADNRITHVLSRDQVDALLDAARKESGAPHLYPVVALAVTTGLRENNILCLRRDEVDFERMQITLKQKRGRLHTVPLTEGAAAILGGIEDDGSGYFFLSPITGRPYGNIRKSWASIKRKAGVNPKFRFHDLRHHAGTRIYELTKDLQLVQAFLGHTQISTTLRYAHLAEARIREAVRGLDITVPHTSEVPNHVPQSVPQASNTLK